MRDPRKDEAFSAFLETLRSSKVFRGIEKDVRELQELFGDGNNLGNNENLQGLAAKQREIIERQHKLLEKVMGEPAYFGRVITVLRQENKENSKAVVRFNGRLAELSFPQGLPISSGDLVKLSSKTLQIIDKAAAELDAAGDVWVVRKIGSLMHCEVENRGDTKWVLRGFFNEGGLSLEIGDRVVIDESRTMIIGNRGKPENRFRFTEKADVTWDDIGGLEEAKAALREMIEDAYRYKELYEYHGNKLPNGVLLFGPPGCGKTLLGKAVANAMLSVHRGKGSESAFLYIKAPDILEKYVGEAEKTIKNDIFEGGREYFKKYGYRQIAFIDEADAILYKRGTGKSSDVERTIVTMFLAEMDGMDATGPIIMLATNQPQLLDPAIVRHNRMDIRIEVKRPTRQSSVQIFSIHFKGAKLADAPEEMAEYAAEELFSNELAYWEIKKTKNDSALADNEKSKEEIVNFSLGNMVDGAMIAAVVKEAKSIVFQRDKKNGTRSKITKEDIRQAVRRVYRDSYALEQVQVAAIKEFTNDFQDGVPVRKLKMASV